MDIKKRTKIESKKDVVGVRKEIRLPPIEVNRISIKVKGTTPLLHDRFPPEVKNDILAKQTGNSRVQKKVRNTAQEVKRAIHYMPDGKTIGFPVMGFKKGMVEATSFVGDKSFSKKLIKGSVKILAPTGIVPIQFKGKMQPLEHNIGPNTKFSPMFNDWSCTLDIVYDSQNVSPSDIVTLLNYAGFYMGVGAWRPQCGGDFGRYEVDMPKKKK